MLQYASPSGRLFIKINLDNIIICIIFVKTNKVRYFRTEQGDLVNCIDHCLQEVKKHPDLRIYIGTDSQNYGANTVYVTAIVFRYGTRGAHYIYNKTKVPRISDIFSRLFKEGEMSMECASFIQSNSPIKVHAIEFDYNNKKITKSTNLVSTMRGWAESEGYKALVKPDELLASKAADHLCRL